MLLWVVSLLGCAATKPVPEDHFYQLMFLAHLSLGLLLVLPFVLFGALHLRNARRRPNRPAVRAGFALYASGLLLVLSAASDPSYAVEEDYYQKALAWDEKRAQYHTNEVLG